MTRHKIGTTASVGSSALFGLNYYLAGLLHGRSALEVTAWRVIVTALVLLFALGVTSRGPHVRELGRRVARQPYLIPVMVITSALVGVQLWLFVWAPSHGQALPVSLGYFLLPLVMVLAGRYLFGEGLSVLRRAAVASAGAGVFADFVIGHGVAWPTIVVAAGYPCYFVIHRRFDLDTLEVFCTEMWILLPLVVPLAAVGWVKAPLLPGHAHTAWLVAGVAVVGALAMIAYIAASGLLPTTVFGMLGYVEPVLLVVASILTGAHLHPVDLSIYLPIVAALVLMTVDGMNVLTNRQPARQRSDMNSRSIPAGIEVVVLDVVGTLVDEVGTITSAVRQTLSARGIPAERATALAQQWLDRFDDATRRIADNTLEWRDDGALRRSLLTELLGHEQITLTPTQFAELSTAGYRLVAWPGTAGQLDRLAARVTLTGLTNASTDQVAAISRRQNLRWHTVLSTALARTYKPSPAAYQLAIDQLALDPQKTLFIAAHPWDLRAAASHGFRTAYLPREHAARPEPADRFDVTLDSIDDLVNALPPPRD